ncbi:hypothetical protein Q2Y28_004311 [Vibrio vulnificus]|nr:hypothetical protein [Vibrio vulnificus]ELM6618730.1 hypothetical protein [Vibrio vulnificus]
MQVRKEFKPRRKVVSVRNYKDGSSKYKYGYKKADILSCYLRSAKKSVLNLATQYINKLMFLLCLTCVFLLVKESNFTVWSVFEGTFVEPIFIASDKSAITLSIVTGILSGFFIWLFDVYIPRGIERLKQRENFQTISGKLYSEAESVHKLLTLSINPFFKPHILAKDEIAFHSMCDVLSRDNQHSLHFDTKSYEQFTSSLHLYSMYLGELAKCHEVIDYELSTYIQKRDFELRAVLAASLSWRESELIGELIRNHGYVLALLADSRFMAIHDHSRDWSYEFKMLLANSRRKSA